MRELRPIDHHSVAEVGGTFFVNIFIKGYPVAIISYMRDLFGQVLVSLILGLILVKGAEKALPSLVG